MNLEVLAKSVRKRIFEFKTKSGYGSAVLETLSDANLTMKTLRLGLPDKYIFENGSRDYLIDNNGLSCDDIYQKIINFLEVL